MSKAIRILPNMPGDCGKCDIRVWIIDLGYICPSMGCVNEYIGKGCPDWCPLVPMPDYQEVLDVADNYYGGYAYGWNECLDEIGGGDNG